MKDIKIAIKRMILKFSYMQRIIRLEKANDILMKEYDEHTQTTCSLESRSDFIKSMKIINKYTSNLLDEMRSL